VLPYAIAPAYGTADELKALVDTAHGLGMMVLLDVVYNHFGPDGNYLPAYAEAFFDEGRHTPWGPAIAFGREPVARFFIDNALYWLETFRLDGLRFDAVHAIGDNGFLDAMAAEIRARITERPVHLVLENETNDAARLSPATTPSGTTTFTMSSTCC
jgi:maltooligosyltrehalose trehalohydrolase